MAHYAILHNEHFFLPLYFYFFVMEYFYSVVGYYIYLSKGSQ